MLFRSFAQDDPIKDIELESETLHAIVLNKLVEFVPRKKERTADFALVDIKFQGKIVKTFPGNLLLFPEIIGSFKALDSEYVLFRSYMGQGGCGSGSLYVIRFLEDTTNEKLSGVIVSTPLTTCLGDGPTFGFAYNSKGKAILSVLGNSLNLEEMGSWILKKEPPTKTTKRN